jgi:hypothetical protein
VESFLAVAAEQGFQFTADDFLEASQQMGIGDTSGELSDDALQAVAGGLTTFSSRQMTGMTSRAFKSFGRLRNGLGIRGIGHGAVMQAVEEEEIQP